MKRIFLFFIIAFLPIVVFGQAKIGFVNTEVILKDLPEAQDAQKKLDNLVKEWQGDLKKLEEDWKKKYDDYEKNKLIMSDQTRIEKERELVDLENKISQFREQKFGQNGELFTKQEEFMKPIHNKIFNVIQQIAKDDNYDYIFDKSGDILLLFANDKYDLTNEVLKKMK